MFNSYLGSSDILKAELDETHEVQSEQLEMVQTTIKLKFFSLESLVYIYITRNDFSVALRVRIRWLETGPSRLR
jgi:hypothetical protein